MPEASGPEREDRSLRSWRLLADAFSTAGRAGGHTSGGSNLRDNTSEFVFDLPDAGIGTTSDEQLALTLARIGAALEAQRVELFERHHRDGGGVMELVGWWAAMGQDEDAVSRQPIPTSWFPWSLGNIRPASHVFVRNAAPLPFHPWSTVRLRDVGIGSALHLPLRHELTVDGAICAYWADERDNWPTDAYDRVFELGRDLLR
jgi:hypothetical protein